MQVLNFQTGINFGAKGNLKEFSPRGFSPTPDEVSTWSEASVAEVIFRLPPLRHDVRFVIEVFPFLVADKLTQQQCWVFLNGLFVHFHTIMHPVEMIFTVSRDILNPRANRMAFALPDARSPKDLQIGNDLRLLGLSFVKLSAGAPPSPAPERREGEPAERSTTPPERSITPPPVTARPAPALDPARPAERGAGAPLPPRPPSPPRPGRG